MQFHFGCFYVKSILSSQRSELMYCTWLYSPLCAIFKLAVFGVLGSIQITQIAFMLVDWPLDTLTAHPQIYTLCQTDLKPSNSLLIFGLSANIVSCYFLSNSNVAMQSNNKNHFIKKRDCLEQSENTPVWLIIISQDIYIFGILTQN